MSNNKTGGILTTECMYATLRREEIDSIKRRIAESLTGLDIVAGLVVRIACESNMISTEPRVVDTCGVPLIEIFDEIANHIHAKTGMPDIVMEMNGMEAYYGTRHGKFRCYRLEHGDQIAKSKQDRRDLLDWYEDFYYPNVRRLYLLVDRLSQYIDELQSIGLYFLDLGKFDCNKGIRQYTSADVPNGVPATLEDHLQVLINAAILTSSKNALSRIAISPDLLYNRKFPLSYNELYEMVDSTLKEAAKKQKGEFAADILTIIIGPVEFHLPFPNYGVTEVNSVKLIVPRTGGILDPRFLPEFNFQDLLEAYRLDRMLVDHKALPEWDE